MKLFVSTITLSMPLKTTEQDDQYNTPVNNYTNFENTYFKSDLYLCNQE